MGKEKGIGRVVDHHLLSTIGVTQNALFFSRTGVSDKKTVGVGESELRLASRTMFLLVSQTRPQKCWRMDAQTGKGKALKRGREDKDVEAEAARRRGPASLEVKLFSALGT